MKPVNQTKFGEEGNCLQACIASLLELKLEDVPEFPHTNQFNYLQRFMRQHGLQPVAKDMIAFNYPYNVYYLLWGKSPRGFMHSVVAWNGKTVHDPHPEGGGLVTVEFGVVFIATFEKPERSV